MRCDLASLPPIIGLPDGFAFLAWREEYLTYHADLIHQSFRDELDSLLFPVFRSEDGCRNLMEVLRFQSPFCAEASWMIRGINGPVGAIQGILESSWIGAIQNLAILPEHRHIGLGRALLLKAMEGFRSIGLQQVSLEVSARNENAIKLYRSVGFRSRQTFYRTITSPTELESNK